MKYERYKLRDTDATIRALDDLQRRATAWMGPTFIQRLDKVNRMINRVHDRAGDVLIDHSDENYELLPSGVPLLANLNAQLERLKAYKHSMHQAALARGLTNRELNTLANLDEAYDNAWGVDATW